MVMKNEMKDAMIASIDKSEAIENFLRDWYSVCDLNETAANAGSVITNLVIKGQCAADDAKWLMDLLDQHVMMTKLLKGGEL